MSVSVGMYQAMEAVGSFQPMDGASTEPLGPEFSDSPAGQHHSLCKTFTIPLSPVATKQSQPVPLSAPASAAASRPATLHIEVLQHSFSSLSESVVREYAVAQLRHHPTAFGEFVLTEFDDPVLKEHVVSISVRDIPTSVRVRSGRWGGRVSLSQSVGKSTLIGKCV